MTDAEKLNLERVSKLEERVGSLSREVEIYNTHLVTPLQKNIEDVNEFVTESKKNNNKLVGMLMVLVFLAALVPIPFVIGFVTNQVFGCKLAGTIWEFHRVLGTPGARNGNRSTGLIGFLYFSEDNTIGIHDHPKEKEWKLENGNIVVMGKNMESKADSKKTFVRRNYDGHSIFQYYVNKSNRYKDSAEKLDHIIYLKGNSNCKYFRNSYWSDF